MATATDVCDSDPEVTYADVTVPGFLPDIEPVRLEMSEYYTSVRRMDAIVDRLIHVLGLGGVPGQLPQLCQIHDGPGPLGGDQALKDRAREALRRGGQRGEHVQPGYRARHGFVAPKSVWKRWTWICRR